MDALLHFWAQRTPKNTKDFLSKYLLMEFWSLRTKYKTNTWLQFLEAICPDNRVLIATLLTFPRGGCTSKKKVRLI